MIDLSFPIPDFLIKEKNVMIIIHLPPKLLKCQYHVRLIILNFFQDVIEIL